MYFKYLIDQNQNNNFRRYFFVHDFTKDVMTFFEKFVDYDANHVIFVRIKKINDEVHDDVLSTFVDYNNEN